jgi:hypothetical protein
MTTTPTTPETWPVSMPGAADDPRGPRGEAARLLDAVARDSVPLRQVLTDPALPAGVRRQADDALNAVADVRKVTHHAAGQLDQLATNDLLPEAARARVTRERKALTAAALREIDGRSAVAIKLLEAGLTDAAQPTFPAAADRTEARERFRLLADAADDPAAMVRDLVTDPSPELAAVAASPYARDYLRSRGVPADVIDATALYAAQHALTSGDPTREAAAHALRRVPDLKKLRMQALHAAHFAIGWDG